MNESLNNSELNNLNFPIKTFGLFLVSEGMVYFNKPFVDVLEIIDLLDWLKHNGVEDLSIRDIIGYPVKNFCKLIDVDSFRLSYDATKLCALALQQEDSRTKIAVDETRQYISLIIPEFIPPNSPKVYILL